MSRVPGTQHKPVPLIVVLVLSAESRHMAPFSIGEVERDPLPTLVDGPVESHGKRCRHLIVLKAGH